MLLSIRSFRRGLDEEAFVRIFNVAFGDYDDIRMMTIEDFEKVVSAPNYNADGLFIADFDGETVGMVDAYADRSISNGNGVIQWLGVFPEFRGRGIGRKLVERALESLRARGTKVVDAWAEAGRLACVHVFESFGFKPVRVTNMMKRSLIDVESTVVGFEIREMRVDDDGEIALLNRLDNEAFREHFNYKPKSVEETRYALFEMPWFRLQKVFFACLRGEPVGYVIAGVDVGPEPGEEG